MRGQADKIITELATMDRHALVNAIMNLECEFPLDFTDQYLLTLTEEKLRHLYMALHSHGRGTRQLKPSC